MSRPFFLASITDLETEFVRCDANLDGLRQLEAELIHRTTERAAQLRVRVAMQLSQAENNPSQTSSVKPPQAKASTQDAAAQQPQPQDAWSAPNPKPSTSPVPVPLPPVTNKPESILLAWTALEVLSPPPFRPDKTRLAKLDDDQLPWERGEKSRPNMRLYYQIVLGTVDMETAVGRLLTVFSDTRDERPAARGEAILAIVIVDQRGRLAAEPAVAVSSFGWGVPRALTGNLAGLAEWPAREKTLTEGLTERLQSMGNNEEQPAIGRPQLDGAFQWLVTTIGISSDLVRPPRFAVRCYEYFRNQNPPEALVLNSFYLDDLARARALFAEGKAPRNLRLYLGADSPASRKDLFEDRAAVEAAVAPGVTPTGRWPGAGRHPLVLLQQAAVNLGIAELSTKTGLLAVNGPPGTGKTTLLRDLVAALLTARADIMVTFSDPADAFTSSGERLSVGQKWLQLYRLDDRLKGFEMLVASTNNKAVENVSKELPSLRAIADDLTALRYFSTLSDALFEGETWGLIAAALGSAANRSKFKQTFWWDDEVGLATYLAAAAGTPQFVERVDPKTGVKTNETPRIVGAEQPPSDHSAALSRWKIAQKRFNAAQVKSKAELEVFEKARATAARLPALIERAAATRAASLSLHTQESAANESLRAAHEAAQTTEATLLGAITASEVHFTARPHFFARLFRTERAVAWSIMRTQLVDARKQFQEAHDTATQLVGKCQTHCRNAQFLRQSADTEAATAATALAFAEREVSAVRKRVGKRFVDQTFFAQSHAEKHMSTPWLDDAAQHLRDDVFVAAVALHRAFIDAAAKSLRHNLGVLMNAFASGTLPTAEKQKLMPDLWSSFFLVVPVVSTTFASIDRMLGGLPPESLGWLLVDEAGQALPQAAIGALMRTRRAVVVGDPVQIEPVVTLPDSLTQLICRRFGVAPDRFNAPEASAQTLADAATPYCAEFHGRDGSRTVGVPLLVHRRCAEPMFGIANVVAYDRQMVQAKAPKESAIRRVLGESSWINVEGDAVEKWCPQEGNVVVDLLHRIAQAGVTPDLYIVTPFVVVAENLRSLVIRSGVLSSWTSKPNDWVNERIGTVHTVQGREAEAVIFVLGAPAQNQTGARGWAGGRRNLLNVAVTRAKEVIYVIGNRHLWKNAGVFRELDGRLPR